MSSFSLRQLIIAIFCFYLANISCVPAVNQREELIANIFEPLAFFPNCVSSALTQCELSPVKKLSSEGRSFRSDSADNNATKGIFELLGYSPVCVANALANCHSTKKELEISAGILKIFMKGFVDEISQKVAQSNYEASKNISEGTAKLEQLIIELNHVKNCTSSHQELEELYQRNNYQVMSEIRNITKYTSDFFNEMKNTMIEVQSEVNKIAKLNSDVSDVQTLQIGISKMKSELLTLLANKAANCNILKNRGDSTSGIRTIHPQDSEMMVYCDQNTDGGGWTVFQNRDDLPIRETFEKGSEDYAAGFGERSGEFWLGLDNIRTLVNSTPMELRVDLEDSSGEKRWAKYEVFSIRSSADAYRLKIDKYSGDAGDSLGGHNGMTFLPIDQDYEEYNYFACNMDSRGGWWNSSCGDSNLNGYQHVGDYSSISSINEGIFWRSFHHAKYSLKKASMKVRPVQN